jgi:hypothetical protein
MTASLPHFETFEGFHNCIEGRQQKADDLLRLQELIRPD